MLKSNFLTTLCGEQDEVMIEKLVLLSMQSVQEATNNWQIGLKSNNDKMVRDAIHLMRPNLIHLDMDYIESLLKKTPHSYKWRHYHRVHKLINTTKKRYDITS